MSSVPPNNNRESYAGITRSRWPANQIRMCDVSTLIYVSDPQVKSLIVC